MRFLIAGVLYALACFALQEVPRGAGGWTLAGICGIGAALPLLLWLARRPQPPPTPRMMAALGCAVAMLGLAQLGFAIFRTAKLKVIDIGATTIAALAALAHGGNPYALPIDLEAAQFHGYKYLPVMLAAYAPLAAFGLRGIVLTNLALQGATAAALRALAARINRSAGLAAAAFHLAIPFFAFQLFARGVNDLVAVLPLLLALLALERRPFLAGMLVGLSLAAKLMPGAAALLCLLPGPGARRAYAWGVLVGLLPVVPFVLWGPAAFADNILLFNALRPIDDTSWLWGLPAGAALAARLVAVAALAALYLHILRHPPRLETRLILLTAAILLVFAVGPDMHHNYYLWFLPLLAPLAALAAAGAQRA